ncbi:MAG: tetratricopeptide repeat protein, partial [Bacteroidota bacterium]
MYSIIKKSVSILSIFLCALLWLLNSCTNKKNTFVTRTFHNITSRYNGYYWATESIKDGVYKIEQGHKEDFSKTLPLFIYPDNVSCKTIFPEMDRAIKKSSTVIQRHAIQDKKTKQEIPGAVKWIDDNWLVIGKSHFYKREFFSGVEIFEYVAKTYKSKQRYEAKLWLIRTFNEIGTLSQSESVIAGLKNDKNFPHQFQQELQSLITEFYIKQGLYDEATKALEKTISLTKKKKSKARYTFIMAQLLEAKKDNKKAIYYYDKCIGLKPAYEMLIQAKIKKSRLYEGNDSRSKGVKQELLKMAKDPKNEEYLDIIYFTLGEMEEKANKIDQAMTYYKKSAQSSVNNNNQKAASYLKLADHSFDKTNYVAASSYYDSAVAVLDKKHPNYDNIVSKQKNLSTLITNINIIKNEDSLQAIAKMDSVARMKVIDKMIKVVEDEEERKKEELEKLKEQNQNLSLNNNQGGGNNTNQNFTAGDWYMYNQQTKAFGVNEFIKKFGNRKLEDNWRRSNKQSSNEQLSVDSKDEDTSAVSVKGPKDNDKTKPEYYLKQLPLTKEKIEKSDEKILEAYYLLGSIYREALNNHEKAISSFDEMNKRFSGNKYEANTYYQCYRMCLQDKNSKGSEKYKALLLQKYPESDYAKILKDPDFQNTVNAKRSEIEQFYGEAYELFLQNKINESLEKCNSGISKYAKSEFGAKFSLVRAMCIGKLNGMDSMAVALTSVIAKYSKDVPVKAKAQELLDYINQQKGSNSSVGPKKESDIFNFNESAEHFWICYLPRDFNGENSFKAKLSDYNNKYYSTASLEVNSIQYDQQGLVFVKKFKDKQTAMTYFESLEENNEPFDASALAKNKSVLFVISQDNFQKMVQQKKLNEYLDFF